MCLVTEEKQYPLYEGCVTNDIPHVLLDSVDVRTLLVIMAIDECEQQ